MPFVLSRPKDSIDVSPSNNPRAVRRLRHRRGPCVIGRKKQIEIGNFAPIHPLYKNFFTALVLFWVLVTMIKVANALRTVQYGNSKNLAGTVQTDVDRPLAVGGKRSRKETYSRLIADDFTPFSNLVSLSTASL